MTTALQTVPYLPGQRNFPNDNVQQLGVVLDKTYIEIAARINERTIGIFGVGFPIITGEKWYLTGQPQKQQTIRQLYFFTTTAAINHGIAVAGIDRFVRNWGEYTDGTNWYGLIHASNVAIPGQITFYVTPTQIVFLVGAGAPALTSGTIVLEWLSLL